MLEVRRRCALRRVRLGLGAHRLWPVCKGEGRHSLKGVVHQHARSPAAL